MTLDIYLGVDGCQAGWLSVEYCEGSLLNTQVFSSIQTLWTEYSKANVILIDIPIGLLDEGSDPRKCDAAARKYLTRARSSSVFPVPCRSAVYASDYLKANEINREKMSKGVSKQAWNITPKIREVDTLLRDKAKTKEIFIESHPEVCFTALANGIPMQFYKKKELGIEERINLLKKYDKDAERFIYKEYETLSKNTADLDDIFDACVLSISASFGMSDLIFLPDDYEYDSEGLPMRMALPKIK